MCSTFSLSNRSWIALYPFWMHCPGVTKPEQPHDITVYFWKQLLQTRYVQQSQQTARLLEVAPGLAGHWWEHADGSWAMAHRLLSKVILNNCTYIVIYNTRVAPVTTCVRHFAKLLHILQTDTSLLSYPLCRTNCNPYIQLLSVVPGSGNTCSLDSHQHIYFYRWTRSAHQDYLMKAAC